MIIEIDKLNFHIVIKLPLKNIVDNNTTKPPHFTKVGKCLGLVK